MLSPPDFYEGVLSQDAQQARESLEEKVSALYADLKEARGVERLKLQKRINNLETALSWQGANPKVLDIAELAEHIREKDPNEDAIVNKYRARIGNRATGIRAYCVQCQGGETAAVRECVSLTCPLHPFRMGKDPFRGYELPKAEMPEIEEEDDGIEFEDGDEGEDADDAN